MKMTLPVKDQRLKMGVAVMPNLCRPRQFQH
jgi:hypothetical protein